MQNSEFEKNVQRKMGDLKFVPGDGLWEKIEAGLPKKERSRRWIFFILLFMGLGTASGLLWNKLNDNGNNIATPQTPIKNNPFTPGSPGKVIAQNESPATIVTDQKNDGPGNNETGENEKLTEIMATNSNSAQEIKSYKNNNVKKSRSISASNSLDATIAKSHKKKFSTKSGTKIKVKKSVATVADDSEDAGELTADAVKTPVENDTPTDSLTVAIKKATTDSLLTAKTDTARTEANKTTKQKKQQKWLYGIDLAIGRSNVKSSLFNSEPVYAGAALNSSATPGGGGGAAVSMPTPNNPSAGKAIAAGFYIEKTIHPKWTVRTGLNYMYQSNTIQTGQKVDSSIRYNFSMLGTSLYADNYYRSGNTVNYTNAFHVVELPLMLQFKLNQKLPVYVEAGPSISWLINSNALIYNNSTSTYFSSDNMFNKLLFSVKAGAGFDIAKRSKLPFSIGYQFKYSINSAIKTNLAKQHFINSLIYVKVPLKK